MRKIQDLTALTFIFCTGLLATIAVLGVWAVFTEDVIGKSFSSVSLLSAVAVIVLVADRFLDVRKHGKLASAATMSRHTPGKASPVFTIFRQVTVIVLVGLVSLGAFIGIMAIWDVVSGEMVYRWLATIAIGSFAAAMIVMTCLERENHKILHYTVGQSSGMGLGMSVFVALLCLLGLGWVNFFL